MDKKKKLITIINGSPRINGNTDIIIKELMETIHPDAAEVEVFKLRDMNINDCLGCYGCMKNGQCVQKDDMTKIYDSLERSEVIVFASPIYWGTVPGTMKKLIDRLFAYYFGENRTRLKGKKAITIAPLNQLAKEETDMIQKTYKMIFDSYGILSAGEYYFHGVMEKGRIAEIPEYLQTIKEIGNKISDL
jgi:multimeric flavodoxin WrbA